MRNMLIVPTEEELKKDFSGEMDFTVFNGGEMHAPKGIPTVTNETCVSVNFSGKNMAILGT